MIFARWVAGLLLAIALARMIANWIDRKRPGRFVPLPAEEGAETLQEVDRLDSISCEVLRRFEDTRHRFAPISEYARASPK